MSMEGHLPSREQAWRHYSRQLPRRVKQGHIQTPKRRLAHSPKSISHQLSLARTAALRHSEDPELGAPEGFEEEEEEGKGPSAAAAVPPPSERAASRRWSLGRRRSASRRGSQQSGGGGGGGGGSGAPSSRASSLAEGAEDRWEFVAEQLRSIWAESHKRAGPGGELGVSRTGHMEHYPYWGTSVEDLAGFGIGVGLYFETLRSFALLMLVYGLLNLPLVVYYHSTKYSMLSVSNWWSLTTYAKLGLEGSALCESYEDVTATAGCPGGAASCAATYAGGKCAVRSWLAVLDLAAIAVLSVYLVVHQKYVERMEVVLDLAVQTAQDYSVEINDPGPGDDDPDRWRAYFEARFGKVASVTVVRANAPLARLLRARRRLVHTRHVHEIKEHHGLLLAAEGGRAAPEAAPGEVRALLRQASFNRYDGAIREVEDQVRAELRGRGWAPYPADRVFVTFEDEEGQRACLAALTSGYLAACLDLPLLDEKYQFVGQDGKPQVLEAYEAPEPDDIIYENLDLTPMYLFAQFICTLIFTLGFVCGIYIVLSIHSDWQSYGYGIVGLVVIFVDEIMPDVIEYLASKETHLSKAQLEEQIMFKLTCARILNSAIVNFLTTSYTQNLTYGVLSDVQSIFLGYTVLIPLIKVMDLAGVFRRQVMARLVRCETQAELDAYFRGSEFEIGNYYTGISTMVFLALFYAPIFPEGPLYAAAFFAATFLTDKWLLLRRCAPPAKMGAELAKRQIFYVLAGVLSHLFMCTWWYYGWPFDTAYLNAAGAYEYIDKGHFNGASISEYFSISKWVSVFFPDDQPWMTSDQDFIIQFYMRGSLALLGVLGLGLLAFLADEARRLFCGVYAPVGDPQGVPHSAVRGTMEAYVPVLEGEGGMGPLLCANLRGVPYDLLPEGFDEYDVYEQNMALDIPDPEMRRQYFSICKFYNEEDDDSKSATSAGDNDSVSTSPPSPRTKKKKQWGKGRRHGRRRRGNSVALAEGTENDLLDTDRQEHSFFPLERLFRDPGV